MFGQGEIMKDKRGLLVSCVLLFCAPLVLNRSTRAQETPRRIEITASKFAFTPSTLNLKKGQPVVLVLKSSDVAHGLRFRELNLDLKAGKGETSELSFTPDKTGDFVGHCSVFCGSGHGSMELSLHVEE
jgi:cytochrome c oxidase subunit 2